MRKSSFAIFIVLFCWAFSLQAQTNPNQSPTAQINFNSPVPVDPNVRIGKLPNGLTYYIRRNEKPEKKIELRLAINVGSNLEREDQRGLAHFLEHMAFNGTTNFPHNELVSYLQSIGVQFGADLNAYTSFDETVYILPIPTARKELVDKGLLVLRDWAGGITLDQSEIDKERGVVLEERRTRLGAGQRILDKYFPELYAGSQYAERMPIGTEQVLKNFDRKTLLDFYETWYRPDLMAIVAVGDLDVNEMEAKIKRQFSDLKAKRKDTKRPDFPVPDTKGTLVSVVTDKEASGTSVLLLYKKPDVKIRTEADLRREIINQFYITMLNGRLGELRQSPNSPFAYAVARFTSFSRDKDAFVMTGQTDPASVEATITALFGENRRAQEFGFTQSELDRAKALYQSGLESRYQDRNKAYSSSFANEYVSSFLRRNPIIGIDFDYNFGKRVVPTISLAEVNQAVKEMTTENNRAVIVSGPEKADFKYPGRKEILKTVDDAARAKLEPYKETVVNEPLIKELPANAKVVEEKKDAKFGITYWTLSNGVRVVLKPTDFQAESIIMFGLAAGGMSLIDTEKTPSLSYFKSVAGQSGVKNLSRIQLDKMLEGKRVGAEIGVNYEFDEVSGYSTPKDLETMLQLAYLKFTDMNFDKTVFDSIIAKQRKVLPQMINSPDWYFLQQVSNIMSQNHPRVSDSLDVTILDRIKFDEIQAIYKDRFNDASDFTFIFVGNFEPEKIKQLVAKYLGNLPSTNRKEAWKDWGIRPPAGPLNRVFKKGADDKSTVQIVYTGDTEYSSRENLDLSMLGSLLRIKLVEDLREAKSGVYGVGAQVNMQKIPHGSYSLSVQFSCAPQNVDDLTKEVTAIITKIQNGEIDEKDVNKIKEAWLVNLEETYKNNRFWLQSIIRNLKQGDEIYTPDETKAHINAVGKANIQKAAQKYLKPANRLQFVLMPETAAATNAGGKTK